MALFKEYKKKSVSDPRRTFDAIITEKLDDFDEIISKNNSQSKIAYDESIEYLLDVAPFIKEYYDEENCKPDNDQKVSAPTNISHYVISQQNTQSKGAIYEKYMKHIGESTQIEYVNDSICKKCNAPKLFDNVESINICTVCGEVSFTIEHTSMTTAPTAHGNEQNEVTPYYCYKRSNHFSEWLSQIQGKETTFIPDSVYDDLSNELKKERIIDPNDITHSRIRLYLKKLRLNKYYEHIPHIIRKFKGVPPPRIRPEIEETLRQMFYLIQEPFKKHCPKERKNFLSYSYTLYKMSEILGEDDMLEQFTLPLLKSRDKLGVQDKIWKGICSELNWEYIPTI